MTDPGAAAIPPVPPSPLRPLAAQSGRRLSPLIYDLIKERLLDGSYGTGGSLAVERLKAEFGVSKQPIMDALRRLATEGLVEIIPQVGSRVPTHSTQDLEDFYAMFAGMEGAVAGVAAQRAGPAQLSDLERTNREIRAITRQRDPGIRAHDYRTLNRAFHAGINAIAHSPVIADISRRMWDMSDLLINTSGVAWPLAGAVRERADDHDRIIAALAEGDAAAARREMEGHILGTVDIIDAARRRPD